MGKIKKRLTQQEEFDILKLVLDKFLLLGFAVMAFGLYIMYDTSFGRGMLVTAVGAIILVTFVVVLVKEYELIK